MPRRSTRARHSTCRSARTRSAHTTCCAWRATTDTCGPTSRSPPIADRPPTIRGYTSDAIAIPFQDARGENGGRLGGARSLSTAAELRVPIRPLRRNAFAPFVDAASVAGAGEALFDRLHLAAGASYYFSFFSERLEGFVYGAVPFESETEWQLIGAGVGGSF
jgi:hypothetical protein